MIETERLEIHAQTINRPECTGGLTRTVWHAWIKFAATGEDVAKPVVIVTLGTGNFVEWIHTDEQNRRKGFATETLQAIETSVGDLVMDAATGEGEAFLKSYYFQGKVTE